MLPVFQDKYPNLQLFLRWSSLHFVKKPSPVVSVPKCPCHLFLPSVTSLSSDSYYCVTVDLNYTNPLLTGQPATSCFLILIQICLHSSLTHINNYDPSASESTMNFCCKKKKFSLVKLLSGALNYLHPNLLIILFSAIAYILNL